MKIPCIKCGKHSSSALCDSCYLQSHELFAFRQLEPELCRRCGFFYIKGNRMDEKQAAELAIESRNRIVAKSISAAVVGNSLRITAECKGYIKPAKEMKAERKSASLKIKKRMCDVCTKISGNYHEAVFQIRGSNAEKIIKKLQSMRAGTASGRHDINFINKKEAAWLAKSLEKEFIVKRSFKQVGEKKGRKLYRNYYSIR